MDVLALDAGRSTSGRLPWYPLGSTTMTASPTSTTSTSSGDIACGTNALGRAESTSAPNAASTLDRSAEGTTVTHPASARTESWIQVCCPRALLMATSSAMRQAFASRSASLLGRHAAGARGRPLRMTSA